MNQSLNQQNHNGQEDYDLNDRDALTLKLADVEVISQEKKIEQCDTERVNLEDWTISRGK